MSFFSLRFDETTLCVFRLVSWTKNGPKMMTTDRERREERFRLDNFTHRTNARFKYTPHTDNADRGRAQKPGRLSNVPDMPRDLQSAV